jgi:hypothetical protein
MVKVNCIVKYLSFNRNDNTVNVTVPFKRKEMVNVREEATIERQLIKEVLRRENQGLKVYPVDDPSVFSMTGTYF